MEALDLVLTSHLALLVGHSLVGAFLLLVLQEADGRFIGLLRVAKVIVELGNHDLQGSLLSGLSFDQGLLLGQGDLAILHVLLIVGLGSFFSGLSLLPNLLVVGLSLLQDSDDRASGIGLRLVGLEQRRGTTVELGQSGDGTVNSLNS